jgi:hypothetical protein
MKNVLAPSLFIFFLFTASLSIAQMVGEEVDNDTYFSNRAITINPEERNYSGSAYENKEFVNGYVFNDAKIVASNVALRYNAKREEIEIKNSLSTPDEHARLLVRNPKIYVKMGNKVFVYMKASEQVTKPGYFVVLEEGEHYSLFKKITKKFIEGRESVNSITRDTPPAFEEKEIYYLVDNSDGSFTAFPKSRNGKLKSFTKHKKEIKEFVKSNKLNVNKEYALAKLVKYYDSL